MFRYEIIERSEKAPDVEPDFRAQLEFQANENFRENNAKIFIRISQTFSEILHFFAKIKIAKFLEKKIREKQTYKCYNN